MFNAFGWRVVVVLCGHAKGERYIDDMIKCLIKPMTCQNGSYFRDKVKKCVILAPYLDSKAPKFTMQILLYVLFVSVAVHLIDSWFCSSRRLPKLPVPSIGYLLFTSCYSLYPIRYYFIILLLVEEG